MKKTKLTVQRETVSKLKNFNFAKIRGGNGASTQDIPPIEPPKISYDTYTCSVCDAV